MFALPLNADQLSAVPAIEFRKKGPVGHEFFPHAWVPSGKEKARILSHVARFVRSAYPSSVGSDAGDSSPSCSLLSLSALGLQQMIARLLRIGIYGGFIAALLLCGGSLAQVAAKKNAEQPAAAADAVPQSANGKEPHEAIFVDWPKPDVALVFSGEQDGYLEPCGCAGLNNQKGGLKRRLTLLKQLRDRGWPVVAMDGGGQEKRSGLQAEIKLDFAFRALVQMGYDVVGFGSHDLRMDLLSIAINLDETKNPLVSANVAIAGFDSGFTQRFKVIEAGGMKIGVTTVLGKSELAGLKNSTDLTLLEPAAALDEVLPKLRAQRCHQLVLLAHAEPDEAEELARRFPDFNWVLAAHGAEVPPKEPRPIKGTKSHLIEVGHKGMYVAVVGLYKSGSTPFRYQRVPLDARFADAPEIYQMQVEYQQRLETLGWEGLGLKRVLHATGRKFAGSQACADCHLAATEVYEQTTHAHAMETLVNKTDPPRQYDPECISCHVTGWHPQQYFPFESGFVGLQETPHLAGNGCENCHGPAAEHVAAENGEIEASDEQLEKLRAQLRLKVVDNEGNMDGQVYGKVVQMCMECHDHDNSPDFDFQEYWPHVKHKGKD